MNWLEAFGNNDCSNDLFRRHIPLVQKTLLN